MQLYLCCVQKRRKINIPTTSMEIIAFELLELMEMMANERVFDIHSEF